MGILGWESTTNLGMIQIIGGWIFLDLDKHDMGDEGNWMGKGKMKKE